MSADQSGRVLRGSVRWRAVCVTGFWHSGVLHDDWDEATQEGRALDSQRCGPHRVLRSDGMKAPARGSS